MYICMFCDKKRRGENGLREEAPKLKLRKYNRE